MQLLVKNKVSLKALCNALRAVYEQLYQAGNNKNQEKSSKRCQISLIQRKGKEKQNRVAKKLRQEDR